MKFKKAISAFAALAMSLSCFAGLTVANAEDNQLTIVSNLNASWHSNNTADGITHVNKSDATHEPLYMNAAKGAAAQGWNGTAVVDFTLPQVEKIRIKSVTLKYTIDSGGNSNNRTYSIFQQKKLVDFTDISSDVATSGQVIYDGVNNTADARMFKDLSIESNKRKNVALVATQTENTALFSYVADNVSADEEKHLEFFFSGSAGIPYIVTETGTDVDLGTDVAEKSIKPTLVIDLYGADELPVGYTINYLDSDGSEIKTARTTGSAIAGTDLVLAVTDVDKETFTTTDGTKKYIYVSNDAGEKKVSTTASENVINLTFREAAKTTYTVNIKTATTKELYKEENFEGEKAYVPFETHILEGNTLYTTSAYNSGGDWGRKTITYTAEDKTDTIDYTAQTGTFVYASEGENIAGLTKGSGSPADIRASNAAVGYGASDVPLTTLPAGKYKVVAQLYGNAGDGRKTIVKAGETTVFTADAPGNPKTYTGEEFTLDAPTALTVSVTGGGKANGLDWIYIERTAAPTPVSNETTSAVLTAEQVTAAGLGPVAEATETVAVPTAVTVDAPVFGATQISAYTTKTIKYVVTNPDTLSTTEAVLKVGDTTVNTWKGEYDAATGEKTYYAQFAVPTNSEAASYSKFGTVTASYGTAKIATYNLATDAVTFAAPASN